jgi:hypothetical protein
MVSVRKFHVIIYLFIATMILAREGQISRSNHAISVSRERNVETRCKYRNARISKRKMFALNAPEANCRIVSINDAHVRDAIDPENTRMNQSHRCETRVRSRRPEGLHRALASALILILISLAERSSKAAFISPQITFPGKL